MITTLIDELSPRMLVEGISQSFRDGHEQAKTQCKQILTLNKKEIGTYFLKIGIAEYICKVEETISQCKTSMSAIMSEQDRLAMSGKVKQSELHRADEYKEHQDQLLHAKETVSCLVLIRDANL